MRHGRKQTAWKKNRKLGQIKGRRVHVKRNSIIRLHHELTAPGEFEVLPIWIQDRPPVGDFWPLDASELERALAMLPPDDVEGITHVWLQTPSTKRRRQGVPLCALTTGRGVRLIVLHPWPLDRTVRFGRTKPSESLRRTYGRYGASPFKKGRAWFATFGEEELRRYFVEELLYACVGDHLFRRKYGLSDSNAHGRRLRSFADDYARQFQWREGPGS